MTYDTTVMTDHMTTRMAELANGTLEGLSASGQVVISFPLGSPAGSVAANGTGARATLSGLPITGNVLLTGVAIASGRLRRSNGSNYKANIPVGVTGSGAQMVVTKLMPSTGDTVQLLTFTLDDAQV